MFHFIYFVHKTLTLTYTHNTTVTLIRSMKKDTSYLNNLVLAVLCLWGPNLASLHTLLHGSPGSISCMQLSKRVFMDLIKSQGRS